MQTGFTPRAKVCKKCRGVTRKKQARLTYVERTYRLSPAEYDAMLANVNNCMCCGRRTKAYKSYSVDHDHAVEARMGTRASIRGLICRSCNKLLRDARDSASLLRRLADYLDSWPTKDLFDFVEGYTVDRWERTEMTDGPSEPTFSET